MTDERYTATYAHATSGPDAESDPGTDAETDRNANTDSTVGAETTDGSGNANAETDDRATENAETAGGVASNAETGEADALLVASLAESTGKTAVTLALATIAVDAGDDVGYMKPKGTRLESNVGKTLDADPMLAREVLDLEAEMHDLEPVVYSPTFVDGALRGREDPDELHERVREAYDALAEGRDRMLLEGGGRLATGGVVDLTDADVADLLDAGVLLIAPYEVPGDVDDVLAAAEAIGDRLVGVLFNDVADAAFDGLEADVVPFLEGREIPVVGTIPTDRTLAGVTVAELADELGAEVLAGDEAGLEGVVERFSVGAMGADSALRHFRRTKNAAVITGGDRSDLQAAALEAPGVECLILTGGHRPSGPVVGRAAEKGVPILTVRTDTLTAVERAEDVVRSGRTRDASTVERMASLLSEHANVDAVLENLD